MSHLNPERKPSFLWQGLLILLPVAVLAVLGLISLRQDRLLADREAKESGESLARHLAKAVGNEIDQQLRDYRNAVFEIQAERSHILTLSTWTQGADRAAIARHAEEIQRKYPELDLSAMPVVDGSLHLDGSVRNEMLPPAPTPWVGELTPEQSKLWCDAQKAEYIFGDLAVAQSGLEQLAGANLSRGAKGNIELLLLNLKAWHLAPAEAAELFASSKWARSPELTDAGLPVGQLICLRALRLAPDGSGLSNSFLQTIARAINYCPSILSPRLVDEVVRVAGTDSNSAIGAAALKGWWRAEESARQVLVSFRDQNRPASLTNRAWWTMCDGEAFMLTLERQNGPFTTRTASGTTIETNIPPYWDIHLFPGKAVDAAVARSFAKVDAAIPAYARAQLEIAGVYYDGKDGARMKDGVTAAWPVLGAASGLIENLPRPVGAVGFPIHVSVVLASSETLYSRQHQRTLMFGGLILAAAAAATTGFLTARRAFYRQLRLNEMKSNFVSSVSHELRAPIASVRLMAEGLEGGRVREPEKQHEYFGFIVQECRRLSSLIENVLDFSRIEQGRKQYEMEPTDFTALVERTVKLMETYAAERQVKITLQKSGEPVAVDLDGKAMQQALINLVDNAIKHSPKGSTIAVGLGYSPTNIQLWVEDKGEGIPPAEHEKIFERFYRVGSELRRETQGVGIGLSIVKHIVEAHGGAVKVRSAPGQGSRFTIEIPCQPMLK